MMLSKLREETSALHKEIEKSNKASLILDHSISLQEYKALLLQNFVAYRIVEDQIVGFYPKFSTDKSERLAEDLNALNVNVESFLGDFENQFQCKNKTECIGAMYVLEGSALGGMLIAKELKNCKALKNIPKQQFFNGDRNNIKSWNQFSKSLKTKDFLDAEIQNAVHKAKDTFIFFGNVFNASPRTGI